MHECPRCLEIVEHSRHVCVPVERQPWNTDYERRPLSGRAVQDVAERDEKVEGDE